MASIDPLDQPEGDGWGDDDELIINEGKLEYPLTPRLYTSTFICFYFISLLSDIKGLSYPCIYMYYP